MTYDQKPSTKIRFNALAGEPIGDAIAFYQCGSKTADEMTMNQQKTRCLDEAKRTNSNFIGLPRITDFGIVFDFNQKNKHEKNLLNNYKVLKPILEPDNTHKMLNAHSNLGHTKQTLPDKGGFTNPMLTLGK